MHHNPSPVTHASYLLILVSFPLTLIVLFLFPVLSLNKICITYSNPSCPLSCDLTEVTLLTDPVYNYFPSPNLTSSHHTSFPSSLGGYGYDSTDMAAIEYRLKTLKRFVPSLILVLKHDLVVHVICVTTMGDPLLFIMCLSYNYRSHSHEFLPYIKVSLVIDIIFATLDARMTIINTTKISEATHTHSTSPSLFKCLSLYKKTCKHTFFFSKKYTLTLR